VPLHCFRQPRAILAQEPSRLRQRDIPRVVHPLVGNPDKTVEGVHLPLVVRREVAAGKVVGGSKLSVEAAAELIVISAGKLPPWRVGLEEN
jgi:hypothetical protein